jgi:integrase-like protein
MPREHQGQAVEPTKSAMNQLPSGLGSGAGLVGGALAAGVGHASTVPQGGPLREQKFVAGIFKPAAARAGLPHRLRFHDLRHTCASLLIAQGASIKAVQAQLGMPRRR